MSASASAHRIATASCRLLLESAGPNSAASPLADALVSGTNGVRTGHCGYSGTFETRLQDAGDDGRVDVGDALELTYHDCHDTSTSPVRNGSLDATVTRVLWNGDELVALEIGGSWAQLEINGVTLNGRFIEASAVAADGSRSLTLHMLGDKVVAFGQTDTLDAVLQCTFELDGSVDFGIDGTLTVGGQPYALAQADRFVQPGAGEGPISGHLALRDAAGNRAVLEAEYADFIQIQFIPAGETQPRISTSQPW